MITLLDDDARQSIDAAIGGALKRLERRAAPLGDGARALAAATSAAAADGKRLRPALVVAADAQLQPRAGGDGEGGVEGGRLAGADRPAADRRLDPALVRSPDQRVEGRGDAVHALLRLA